MADVDRYYVSLFIRLQAWSALESYIELRNLDYIYSDAEFMPLDFKD